MKTFRKLNKEAERLLREGGVGVIPTDTIYGLVGSALNKKAVEKIYKLKKRNPRKQLIVLIGSIGDLETFGVKLDCQTKKYLKKFWPHFRGVKRDYGGQAEKVSVILPLNAKRQALGKLDYLRRGGRTLAFRFPAPKSLRSFLKKTGPLVAPSANLEGKPPAETIREAKKYFGNKIDFYVEAGKISGRPSKLVKIENGRIEVLRK